MPSFARFYLVCGAAAAMLAVIIGAFGAHALRTRVTPELLAVYQTGVQYHFYHALGLIAVALVATRAPELPGLRWAGALMLVGIVLFSGSLYALALTGVRTFGAITPLGGVAFIAAWALLTAAAVRA